LSERKIKKYEQPLFCDNFSGITLKTLKGQNCVVRGGAGFIGSNLSRTLIEQGANVTVFDNLSSGKFKFIKDLLDKGLNFIEGDIRDPAAIEAATKNCKIIFHLAAQTSVSFSMENPKEDCEINVVGTLNVLEQPEKQTPVWSFPLHVQFTATQNKDPHPKRTNKPNRVLRLSKLLGENCCRFQQEQYGLEIVMFRIFNVYGPDCHGVIYDYLKKLQKNPTKLEVLGTGKQSRDFVYVSDMVDILIRAATIPEAAGQTFNVGTGKTTSVAELAQMVIEVLGLKNVNVVFKGGMAWEGDMDITLADNRKAVEVLGWKPQVSLEEGLKKLISSRRY
jgi:UDP-glucose 4-epimerase